MYWKTAKAKSNITSTTHPIIAIRFWLFRMPKINSTINNRHHLFTKNNPILIHFESYAKSYRNWYKPIQKKKKKPQKIATQGDSAQLNRIT